MVCNKNGRFYRRPFFHSVVRFSCCKNSLLVFSTLAQRDWEDQAFLWVDSLTVLHDITSEDHLASFTAFGTYSSRHVASPTMYANIEPTNICELFGEPLNLRTPIRKCRGWVSSITHGQSANADRTPSPMPIGLF